MRKPQHPPVLLYHGLSGLEAPNGPSGKAMFRRQMRHLAAHGYHTLAPDEFVALLDDPSRSRRKSVLITFDDGYVDFYQQAFPLLEELGMTATVFLITDVVEHGLDAWAGPHPDDTPQVVSWTQIRKMSRAGIGFGSHSHTHRKMGELSAEALAAETSKSKAVLEEQLGKEINAFAYPYGQVSADAKRAVREAGYSCAFAWTSEGLDRFELRRRAVGPGSGLAPFRFRLSRVFPAMQRVAELAPSRRKRARTR